MKIGIMNSVGVLLLVIAGCSSVASAGTTTFICKYPAYSDQKGKHGDEAPLAIKFLVDSDERKAYTIGNEGSSKVAMIPNVGGFTLVEISSAGNVMTTVITFKGKSVHSRAGMIGGTIIPSQYYGFCTNK